MTTKKEKKQNDDQQIQSLQQLNKHLQFHPTLNQINKSLHFDKFSIKNRLLSIYNDHLFVTHIHQSYFQNYPLIANLRCGSWYVHPQNYSCYFKSTDGHFGKWTINLRRINPHIFKLITKFNGIIIVDSTRKGKIYPDALQRTIPIWCHVLNHVFDILFGSDINNINLNKINKINQNIPIKLPSWINDSEKDQIEQLTHKKWIKKVLMSNIVSELYKIQKRYKKRIFLEPFWIDRLCDIQKINKILLNIKQKRNGIPVILLTASIPLHALELSTSNLSSSSQLQTVMDQLSSFNYQYIQGAGDDDEHWSCGITPSMFWNHFKLFLDCNSNTECLKVLNDIKLNDNNVDTDIKLNDNDNDNVWNEMRLNELIVANSYKDIVDHTNGMLFLIKNSILNINMNSLDVIELLYKQQNIVQNIVNYIIICCNNKSHTFLTSAYITHIFEVNLNILPNLILN